MNIIDRFLNTITMYRLVLYSLIALLAIAAIFGAFGILPYNPIAIVFSTIFLIAVAWIVNGILAQFLSPTEHGIGIYHRAHSRAHHYAGHAVGCFNRHIPCVGSDASRWRQNIFFRSIKKHIFNPAAFAVAITALALNQSASWWIGGNIPMMAFVIICGLLVIRKVQRFDLALTFFACALISDVVMNAGSIRRRPFKMRYSTLHCSFSRPL